MEGWVKAFDLRDKEKEEVISSLRKQAGRHFDPDTYCRTASWVTNLTPTIIPSIHHGYHSQKGPPRLAPEVKRPKVSEAYFEKFSDKENIMNICEAIRKRKSTRAFLPKEVEREKIIRILDTARHAPSGANTQPWQVAVISGAQKKELQKLMEKAFMTGETSQKDYNYYPEKWFAPYSGRRTSCGMQLYSALEIARQDKERRQKQWAANYRAFDAPVMLLFFIDSGLAKGSYIDYGMFLQSLMLAAVEEGLATCPQAALAEYPALVRKFLDYPENALLLCGIALGYEDASAPVNRYRTPREEFETFTRFFE